MSESRTTKTIHNMYGAMIYQGVVAILSFVVRRVFTKHISVYYLGLDGLFSNLIMMLTLLDFGIGASAVYYLSRAFADNDLDKVNLVYRAYEFFYRIIACIILIVGVIFSFNLGFWVNTSGHQMSELRFVFYLTFARTLAYYVFACPKDVLLCSQRNYINSNINTVSSILFAIIKIIAISITESYSVYLYVLLAEVLFTYFVTYRMFYRIFPKKKVKWAELKEQMEILFNYGRRLILLSINNFIFNSTDNLIISKLHDVTTVGYMNNYYMIVNAITLIATEIIASSSASIYHFVNDKQTNDEEHMYHVLSTSTFICFTLGMFSSVFLFHLTDQFIGLFFGPDYVMSKMIISTFVMNLMITVMMYPLIYYEEGRLLKPKENAIAFMSAIANIGFSIYLSQYFQATGVLLGTVVANLILFFGRFYIVFKYLHLDWKSYIKRLIAYVCTFASTMIITFFIFPRYNTTMWAWLLQAIGCGIVFIISMLPYIKTKEFKHCTGIVKSMLHIN